MNIFDEIDENLFRPLTGTFSTAMFNDSKRFQREFKSTVESILFDYTNEVVEKDKILEYYNLMRIPHMCI